MTDDQFAPRAHLRSIRTALVAMTVSILTAALIIANEDGLGFPLFVITLLCLRIRTSAPPWAIETHIYSDGSDQLIDEFNHFDSGHTSVVDNKIVLNTGTVCNGGLSFMPAR